MHKNLKKNSLVNGYEGPLSKPKVIVNVINITPDCKADPYIVIREVLLEAAYIKQSVDNDFDSPFPPMLHLVNKAQNWDHECTHTEAFPKDCIDDAEDKDDFFDIDLEDENYFFSIKLREAIDLLKNQGTSHQIIFESLLQAAFDYGVRISDNSITLKSQLLNAVSDVFEMVEQDRKESEI
jgi:hypothetical protein